MKIEATAANQQIFDDFKEMMLVAVEAKIKCRVVNGKLKSNHESESFQDNKDPIWKLQHANYGRSTAEIRSKVRKMTKRLCRMIVDGNHVCSMEEDRKTLKFTNYVSKRWFSVNLRYGYVDFGNELFSAHYEHLTLYNNEYIRNIFKDAFVQQFSLFLVFLQGIVEDIAECNISEMLKPGNFILHNKDVHIFGGNLIDKLRIIRICIRQDESNYIDIPFTQEMEVQVNELVVKSFRDLSEKYHQDKMTDMVLDIAEKQEELNDLKADYAAMPDRKKRRRDEIDSFAKRFHVKVE